VQGWDGHSAGVGWESVMGECVLEV